MKYLKLFTLLALLLTAGGVTTHAQTEDDFWMEINPPTTGIFSLIVDSEGNIIVGATGVYCSRDEGMTWGLIGLEECGILCLYEHTDGTLLAGSNYANSLYKREAGSSEWQALPIPTNASSVSFGVTADNSLLVGTWNGIYKSTDWDSTWTNVFEDPNGNSVVVNLVKLNNGTMLASIKDYNYMGLGGLFQSADNGDTWENLGFDNTDKRSLAKNSQDVIYLGSAAYPMGFHRSSDYGSTWQSFLSDKCVQSLAVDDNDVVYANLYCWSLGWSTGVVRSGDNGETWDYIISGKNREVENLYLSDDGYLYGFGFDNDKIYRSRKSVYEEFEIEVVACPENSGTAIGSGVYHFGERAHLSASANEHYQFVCWTNQDGDTISNEAEYDHMIARGGQITANFQPWEELIITPDTIWVTDVYIYQKNFTALNETDHAVTISNVYPEDTIVSVGYLHPIYGLINVEEVLPFTLEVGDEAVFKTGIQNIILPWAKRDGYIISPIHIVSTEGEDEVIMMIDEAALSFGLVAYGPYYVLESYDPMPFSLVNAEWSGSITITGIEERDTDYLEITTDLPLPVTLENYGDCLNGNFRCKEPLGMRDFATAVIRVHTSIGDFDCIFIEIIGENILNVTEFSDKATIFPNPANGVVHIKGVVADEVRVYNALGQLVKTVLGTNEIDLSGLAEGVYLVRIMDKEGKVYTNKITIR